MGDKALQFSTNTQITFLWQLISSSTEKYLKKRSEEGMSAEEGKQSGKQKKVRN